MFPAYLTLHSLAPAYWIPTYQNNTLSLISIKLYSRFCGAPHEALPSCTFCDSQGHTFSTKTMIKNDIKYINLQVVKKYRSHPIGTHSLHSPIIMTMSRSLNVQFFQQRFGHASHQHIIQMSKLGIYKGLPKSTPKLSHPCCACIISKGTHLPRHPNVST